MKLSEIQKVKFFEKVYRGGDVYLLRRIDTGDEDYLMINKDGIISLYWVDTLRKSYPYKASFDFKNGVVKIQLFKMNDKVFYYEMRKMEV